jgi:thiamine-phosphate pyrophosphorylase
VAVGPVFTTTGKADPGAEVGLSFVRWARAHTAKPLVAIGGIAAGNAAQVLAAGADSVAVLGALCRERRPDDVKRACRRLLAAAAA